MKDNNVVKLKELIEQCDKYANGEITQEELIEWSKKVIIVSYLPIRNKVMNVMNVLFSCIYTEDLLERFITLEMNKFWYLLLGYTNIEIDNELLTEQNYDLLFIICYRWLKESVGIDYDICLDIFDKIMKHVDSLDLKSTFSELANTDFAELIKSDKEMINYLNNNKELIKDLSNILVNSDPNIQVIKDVINKQVQENINKTNQNKS